MENRPNSSTNTDSISDISVPPGFVSLTSFTIKKRTFSSEEVHDRMAVDDEIGSETNPMDAFRRKVDIALKRSLTLKPWILPSGGYNVSEETVSASVTVKIRKLVPTVLMYCRTVA
ncbi:hypothetical protein LIER_07250 [Lithospermum erythrorhizon]|uniref:Uncharacterized protein n=1 Tax=Lithospermum erythrorhizon TaxID=34254 RepID=A0AAV3P906_LITER